MINGGESGGGFSLVEHPMSARALAAPLHRHAREDEYSYVLEGRVGALLGDEVVFGAPGDLIFKPRNQWHTFWNAGDESLRPIPRSWAPSAHDTASRWTPQAFLACFSASSCDSRAIRSRGPIARWRDQPHRLSIHFVTRSQMNRSPPPVL